MYLSSMDTFIYMINVSIIYLCTRLWYSRKAPLVVTLEASSRDQLFSAQGFYWSIIYVSITSNHPSSTHLSIHHQHIYQVYLSIYSSFMSVDLTHICVSLSTSRRFIHQSIHHVYLSIKSIDLSMYSSFPCI